MEEANKSPWYFVVIWLAGFFAFVAAAYFSFGLFIPGILVGLVTGSICLALSYLNKKIQELSYSSSVLKAQVQELQKELDALKSRQPPQLQRMIVIEDENPPRP